MTEITLNKGMVAFVDDKDLELVTKYKWYANTMRGISYAISPIRLGYRKQGSIRMHRLIMNPQENEIVDHADHNGLNNTRSNLRIVSRSQNHMNCMKTKNKTSQYKGVSFVKRRKEWTVYVCINWEPKHVGYFKTEIHAALAYDQIARELFGEYARLNFPIEGEQSCLNF